MSKKAVVCCIALLVSIPVLSASNSKLDASNVRSPLSFEANRGQAFNICGVTVPADFAGLVPGFVGLYQVNVAVPATAPTGDAVNLILNVGGTPSNTVTIAVAP